MKIIKRALTVFVLSLMVGICLINPTNAATATKTAGVRIEKDYVWAISTLYADYNTSTLKITGANMKRVYTYPGVSSSKDRIIALKESYTTGRLTATLGGTTLTKEATIRTK